MMANLNSNSHKAAAKRIRDENRDEREREEVRFSILEMLDECMVDATGASREVYVQAYSVLGALWPEAQRKIVDRYIDGPNWVDELPYDPMYSTSRDGTITMFQPNFADRGEHPNSVKVDMKTLKEVQTRSA